MRTRSRHHLELVVVLLAFASCSFAQANGAYNNPPPQQAPAPGVQPESARPGSLNYIEGQVSSNGQPLTPQSVGRFALQPGQALETGSNGYAEVLLTPGAFLRVGPNSEFRMTSVGLADTRIVLTSGSAMVEADQLISGSHVEVTLGSTSVDLLKKGLYAFTANPPGVRTFDGKADVIDLSNHRDIGKHNEILLANNPELKKTNFDENQAKHDPLYVWSEARSRAEADQNQKVAQNSEGYIPVGSGWFWDPYTAFYGFWPPGYLYSPFGFGFYGGFYPGFYVGYYGGYRGRFFRGAHGVGHGGRPLVRAHGNGIAGGFHGGFGGSHGGGGFHGGGGHR